MCGFAGLYAPDAGELDVSLVERMTRRLAPRGPDGEGVLVRNGIAMGHRRLKIIDLSEHAQQPMCDPELGLDMVFNGCIYNYQALREELKQQGYRFFSQGDSEVILKAYHAWGVDCVKRFNGMFAFAIHERDTGRLILARDRLGIKPLYIAETANGLAFASTLPALLECPGIDKSIDPVALNFYMSFHAVVPAPYTLLKGIRKLPPATVRVYDGLGKEQSESYWRLKVGCSDADQALTVNDWKEQLLEALRLAVKRRMVADVPVGVLLSGGVDSSLIVGLLAEQGQTGLATFSVGFESAGGEKGDEFKYSDLIAEHFGTDHHKIEVPSAKLLETLPETFRAMSEPMVSYDNIGFYLLSQEVSKHLKVVQSGQGADEVFGGYHWYPPLLDSRNASADYSRLFMDRDFAEYSSVVNGDFIDHDFAGAFIDLRFAFNDGSDPVDKALQLDTTVMLTDDPVKRLDNMTMAWGLEARVPFLDHELVELAGRMPAELKVRDEGKWILKEVAWQVIPSQVIDRPKGYFPVPALKYIEGPYLDYVADTLHSDACAQRNLFNRNYVDLLLKEPKEHITPLRGSKLWQVALLELWLQTHGI
ncbi:N-acetylglutaminylglutamine amidotransferase [Sedimenticola selenatireducens]|uniref:asparagine synthase (glutamine-hydrolyzing) n=1 Tax=Sedimenticola selenatireducens TaxID=191960 RepID=A0A557S9V7_9GAMM|nr:N-acetylglutaminylglutamine amidotransferase [Sedimenticola selenatireducens]TVO74215.1 N-acetylglutaminylglutamine amidotransferase [Sedimenticola selenatireducens]TVT62544.1 MAG: N-acetylglutaminylglutamine amidotransferase [Sedimenticola selenatireducens]